MTNLAKANIFEWLCEHGRATKIEIYDQFKLASKRIVDVALEELVTERKLVQGETHYAPARMPPRKVESVAPPPPPAAPKPPAPKPPPQPKPPAPPSNVQRIKALFERVHSWELQDIYRALPDAKQSSVYTYLCQEARKKTWLFKDGSVFTTLRPKPAAAKPTTRSDASEAQRTPEATGTSTKPEAVATPTPVADEHDEGAQTLESPPPAMGPAEASDSVADLTHEDVDSFHAIARELLDDTHALDQGPLPMDTTTDPNDSPEQSPAPTTQARVLVELPGLTIEVKGTADAVRGAVRAIDFDAACFDAA